MSVCLEVRRFAALAALHVIYQLYLGAAITALCAPRHIILRQSRALLA